MCCAKSAKYADFRTFLFRKGVFKMRVTIDLDRDIIIIPDNFFAKIAQENEKLVKYGGKEVKGIDRIKHSFQVAMADTDSRLLTRTNAQKVAKDKKAVGMAGNEEQKG